MGYENSNTEERLVLGPAIKKWPKIEPLAKNILLKLAAVIHDPVTTTDELIPSGETSSYRSDPFALAEFTLSRKVPEYVGRAKAILSVETKRREGIIDNEVKAVYENVMKAMNFQGSIKEFEATTTYGSAIFANKPGDGSAREQAVSCQRVLGGAANIALEYATKRYRSNLINWGMLPFLIEEDDIKFISVNVYIYVPDVLKNIVEKTEKLSAYVISDFGVKKIALSLGYLSEEERSIIAKGCLINFYAKN